MANRAYRLLHSREPHIRYKLLPTWRLFYGIAATCGIMAILIFSPLSPHSFRLTTSPQLQCSAPPFDHGSVVKAYIRPGSGQYIVPYEDRWSLECLHDMVSRTKGYYARDYSVWLGWNNMRYIIETAALHAKLLDRTLVIPSHILARTCEMKIEVCATYATMVTRRKVVSDSEWYALPSEERVSWKIPIQIMLDLDALRNQVPVVTVAEYLELHGLPETLEADDGHWDLEAYHSNASSITPPSLVVIPNDDYDKGLHGVAHVDKLPERQIESPHEESPEWEVYQGLLKLLRLENTATVEDARRFLKEHTGEEWHSTTGMVEILSKYGFAVVHTYRGEPSIAARVMSNPGPELVPVAMMKGFVNDYDHYTEDVVLLQGEIHSDRKPGSMTFTSPAARDDFSRLVFRGIDHLPSIHLLADIIAEHMRELNGGRMWMAAHWRRGDFVTLGWYKGTAPEELDHILLHFKDGTERLGRFRDEGFQPPPTPGIELDRSFDNASLPLKGDRWFMATDERNQRFLQIARAKGAIIFNDLVESKPRLRRLVGWPMLFMDVQALVEQEIMARAAFFFAYDHTSVAGGVANIRTARGMDPRTTVLDRDPRHDPSPLSP